MNVGKKALVFGKQLIHFLTLGFTAFWLIATSKPREPARDCFVALRQPQQSVSLGAALASGAVPSCAGLDGLGPGMTLAVRLTRSTEPPREDSTVERGCWSYQANELHGPSGVTELKPWTTSSALLELDATFVSGTEPTQCYGDYHLRLAPETPVRAGGQVDLSQAGKSEHWRVTRLIRMNQGQSCGLVAHLPEGYCQDVFEVRSVTDAP
jgi:hypothetical protein